MSGWAGWLPLGDGWVADALALLYGLCCVALALCLLFDRAGAWVRARLPQRFMPRSVDDGRYDAWRDLVYNLFGLAALAWVFDALVTALAMTALALFCGVVVSSKRH